MQNTAGAKRSTGRRIVAAILGAFFGLLSGIGFGVLLIEMDVISPLTKTGLVVPIAGVVLGLLVGWFGGRKRTS